MPRAPALCLTPLLAALLGAGAPSASAQGPPLRVTRYTTDDGLAQNQVSGMAKDRAGFLWVGTRRGLQRFDGSSFVPYAELDSAAPPALSGSISQLWTDRRGRLWVGTAVGLFRTDPVKRAATHMPFGQAWIPDSAGRIWFLHDSTLMWVGADDPVLKPRVAGEADAFGGMQLLATTRAGEVLLTTTTAAGKLLLAIDPATGIRREYPFRPGIPSPTMEDQTGRIWAMSESGLEVLEPGARTFRLVLPLVSLGPLGFGPDGSGMVIVNDDGLLWLDHLGRVVDRWAPPEVFGIGTLPGLVLRDAGGVLWIGTLTSGLFRLDPQPPPFELWSSRTDPRLPQWADFVVSLRELPDRSVWAGTLRGGAWRMAPDRGRVDLYPSVQHGRMIFPRGEAWALEEDRAGRLWIGTSAGICLYREEGFRCHPVFGWGVSDISRDAEGWLWLAQGDSGAVSFDPARGRIHARVRDSLTASEGAQVHSVFADVEPGFLWVGSGDLWRTPISGGRPAGPPRRMHEARRRSAVYVDLVRDRAGTLWVGTDEGLLRWDGGAGRFQPVDRPELRNTTIFSIAEDRAGRLWLGTAHGLVQYSPATGVARRYTSADGFLGGELNRRSGLLRRDGKMLFGGINGVTEFDPEAVVGARDSSPVVLTRWRRVTQQAVREVPIDALDTLRVEPDDRSFTLEYVAISFGTSLGRRYRYRLEGLDDDWIETTARQATYSAPRPGQYRFVVQTAAGSEGDWSAEDAVVLRILPPWWATAWFRVVAVLALAAGIWLAHRWRLRHVLATERVRLRISRDLHDEIGAGLSGLALLSDTARSTGTAGTPERAEFERIGSSARAMAADLRDIVWAIDPDADRLGDVLTRMKDVAGTLLPGVRVRFDVPSEQELSARIDMSARRDLLLAYKEMLHNVAKHARATEVEVSLAPRAGALELTVADNGDGLDPTAGHNGTGLKSLAERARRLGGQFELASRPSGGTTARLRLPT